MAFRPFCTYKLFESHPADSQVGHRDCDEPQRLGHMSDASGGPMRLFESQHVVAAPKVLRGPWLAGCSFLRRVHSKARPAGCLSCTDVSKHAIDVALLSSMYSKYSWNCITGAHPGCPRCGHIACKFGLMKDQCCSSSLSQHLKKAAASRWLPVQLLLGPAAVHIIVDGEQI